MGLGMLWERVVGMFVQENAGENGDNEGCKMAESDSCYIHKWFMQTIIAIDGHGGTWSFVIGSSTVWFVDKS